MSTDRKYANRENVPTRWTELDDVFFALVSDALSTSFLWGAAALLASYDPDEEQPAATAKPRQTRPSPSLPGQRSLAA